MTAASGPSDAWGLVEAAQQGDRAAFGELYTRYAPGVSRFVAARTGNNRPLAEDLTSETFTRALRRIESVTYQGKDPGAWLTTIARNLVFDDSKSSRYKLDTPVAEISDADSGDRGPEQTVIDRETAAEVRRHVAQLSTDQRQSIYHRFFEDRSVAETATAMGRSEGAVKALQHRGITALRAAMTADTAPVPPQRGETVDHLASARGAVDEVHQLVTGDDHQDGEPDRAQQLARFHADDQAAEQRGHDRDALAAGGAA
ncbi:MAG: hypothetical protein DLM61_03185 [Pseudonocardiales bacterium]|nr:MAG: hypothetical protein DLM61_03185 [Pseudonocardiales bacterium]